MRSLLLLLLVTVGVPSSEGCTRVEPGYVGLRINQYGEQRGVEDLPIVTGRVWYNPITTDIEVFPTFQQNLLFSDDKAITFSSAEGAKIEADVAVAVSVEGPEVPAIFLKHRQGIEEITEVWLYNVIREAFGSSADSMMATSIAGEGRSELIGAVMANLKDNPNLKGFRFDMVSIVGAVRVPSDVAASINATLTASQDSIKALNKVKQSQAEAQQQVAKAEGEAQSVTIAAKAEAERMTMRADAEAEANKKVSESLTPELLQWKMYEKWKGDLPQVVGEGAIPMFQVGGSPKGR